MSNISNDICRAYYATDDKKHETSFLPPYKGLNGTVQLFEWCAYRELRFSHLNFLAQR